MLSYFSSYLWAIGHFSDHMQGQHATGGLVQMRAESCSHLMTLKAAG